jgi:hypothetical protein
LPDVTTKTSTTRAANIDSAAVAFRRLIGLREPKQLAAAWNDHRQDVAKPEEASREATSLLDAHPELVIPEQYSRDITPCERCGESGPFRRAPSQRIVEILG